VEFPTAPDYSVALGYSASAGATLLVVSSAVNSVSRIVTGYVGDQFGRPNTLTATVLLCVVSVLGLWLGSTQHGGSEVLWVFFVVCYGVAGGGYNALFPTVSIPHCL
jgi:MFS family permease